eukprot:3467601-Pyramimonas_sp.AAC.1
MCLPTSRNEWAKCWAQCAEASLAIQSSLYYLVLILLLLLVFFLMLLIAIPLPPLQSLTDLPIASELSPSPSARRARAPQP